MIIELLYELLADTSPFYFYFSIVMSVIGTIKITQFNLYKFIGHTHVHTKHSHSIEIQSAPNQESIGETTDVMDWIVQKAKRVDAPDDDTDHHAFSFFNVIMKKRGGHRWNENLYSLLRTNIA
ncbi:hypothetical protein [Lentibacillus amyloliquefaciens]|uniref:Uncharacterized protein n=1 Tax=Lentibacillus amyloliquefaciens TaxID=1472767 RepID=A0A0U4E8M4_9BACI|nr:hypothetical protein [Lentibacillus amyloliquefaciens]ALX49628.1 hypothetical protein AOX59_14270 [Lentibacillus amyloliquefaciens]